MNKSVNQFTYTEGDQCAPAGCAARRRGALTPARAAEGMCS